MTIVNSIHGVTLLGGGALNSDDLHAALRFAPDLVAADGGADHALERGLLPQAVIGDLDSLGAQSRHSLPADRLHQIAEQETTDFDKCLREIASPLILGLGFMGGRLDHHLSALSGLLAAQHQRCILLGAVDLCFLAPPQIELDLPLDSRLSLMPLAKATAAADGLEWPLAGAPFEPGGRTGASNRVAGRVNLRVDRPAMLVILPKESLPEAQSALRNLPQTWPGKGAAKL